MSKEKLLGKTPEELKEVVASVGLPAYTAKQLAEWMYVKRVKSLDEMTNISKEGRRKLSENYDLGIKLPSQLIESTDGTKKYLFEFDGGGVEAVMIPDDDRKTLCVSSQVGCKMGCKFCMTGRQGFHGNLSVAEILSQFLSIDESLTLTNTVFMGMGEPLDNYENVSKAIDILTADWGFGWSPKRVTLSTIGLIPALRLYLEQSRCHLAVSLHNPFPEERFQMMPVQKAYDIRDVVELIKHYDFYGQRRVSFEYTMFSGWNDDLRHAAGLARMLKGLECRVNLIRFHQIPDFPYVCSSPEKMATFRDYLNAQGITCTIRASRGEDILAACGMLAGKKNA